MEKLYIPVSVKEMKMQGWEQPDVILFSGDAYVDHPSFANAIIARYLQSLGLKVAMVPQPNWKDDLRDFKKFGVPKLFFAVSAGNMDSMVNHYTASRRLRSDDAYTPGGMAGFRPDYPSQVYSTILKKLFPDTPVILGGIEASLRRLTHYDYWKDQLMPGILQWSGADLLIYGMGEQPLQEIVRLLLRGVPFSQLKNIPQTAFIQTDDTQLPLVKKWGDIELHAHEECLSNKYKYAENFKHIEQESNKLNASRLHQKVGSHRIVVNPPYPPLDENQMDKIFNLPFTRKPHPKYLNKGVIPAYEMIKHSVIMHRGCFGGCSFCTISAHQGKFISSRSEKSVLNEVQQITEMDDFKGYVSDLGGPSANMYKMAGNDLNICNKCVRPSCIFPNICANLNTDHQPLTSVYQKADKIEGVKKTFIGSGVRYDMLLNPKATDNEKKSHQHYMKELISKHVSGRLKVAPEHTSEQVLKLMRKPSFSLFKNFNQQFNAINQSSGINQQLIPYFISSHPGSTDESMAELAIETKALNFNLEQVQDFTPTPMTLATVIYYSGIHPYTMQPVFTAKTKDEKEKQRMFFFWYKPEFRKKISQYLQKKGLSKLESILFNRDSNKPEGKSNKKSNQNKKNKRPPGKK